MRMEQPYRNVPEMVRRMEIPEAVEEPALQRNGNIIHLPTHNMATTEPAVAWTLTEMSIAFLSIP